jgi:hypothetical protein
MMRGSQSSNQVVGNVGMYYVCYRLSRLGWNVMPTARNAKGIDVLVYSQDAKRTHSIQVKALSKRNPVPLGSHTDGLIGDFFVVCCNVASDSPECHVLRPSEVRSLAHKGVKDDKTSFWLQPKHYDRPEFREAWDRIGKGSLSALPEESAIS